VRSTRPASCSSARTGRESAATTENKEQEGRGQRRGGGEQGERAAVGKGYEVRVRGGGIRWG
jgi:hypothetical protein